MTNSCLKGAFYVINVLYTTTALLTAAGAVYFSLVVKELTDLRNYEKYQLESIIHWHQLLPYIFAGVGVLVLLAMCCGCCGMGFNNKELLITYNIFITIVVFVLVAAGAVAIAVATQESKKFINDTIHDVFKEAKLRPGVAQRFGEFEQALHCCGADGVKNYLSVPQSCCDSKDDVTCNDIMNHRKGCIEVANHWIKWIFIIGTTVSGFTALLCVISLILAIAILRNMRRKVLK